MNAFDLITLVLLLLALAGLLAVWLRMGRGGEGLDASLRDELRLAREETARQARELREELASAEAKTREGLLQTVGLLNEEQKRFLADLAKTLREESAASRGEIERLVQRTGEGLKEIQRSNEDRFDRVRATLDEKLRQVQESSEKKLEEMRKTVDEKLHSTLERRLGESFKLVSDRLEAVQRGLGEMQSLATGVGDLKRVLTNVKERGTWGEYRLEAILEEILTPDQFDRNVRPKEGGEQVEFAVKLPGKGDRADRPVWLPIDAKFPNEDYERLQDAAAAGDAELVKGATRALIAAVTKSAREIHDKYIEPPVTTDFAILFLPTEGLYAEILRQPGLHDDLQRRFRVLVAGPTNLAAILNSLRVGFQTLAIEKRAHEVWTVLGAVKSEFGKFGDVLERVKKQLNAASNTIEASTRRTRVMVRTLRQVEQLPSAEAQSILGLGADEDIESDEPESADAESGSETEREPGET